MKLLKHLISGWSSWLFPSLYSREKKALIGKVSRERIALCRACQFNSVNNRSFLRRDEHCRLCGCTLKAKTACLDCSCPLLTWKAYETAR